MFKNVRISGQAIVLLCVLFYFCGMDNLLALLLAAAAHELGHVTSIFAFGGKVKGVSAGISGLCMGYTGLSTQREEAISLLAGPAAGLVYALILMQIDGSFAETSARFSLALSAYNLLPALPLDGGRALKCLLERTLTLKKLESVMSALGISTGAVLLLFGARFIALSYGLPLFTAGFCVLIYQTGIVKS